MNETKNITKQESFLPTAYFFGSDNDGSFDKEDKLITFLFYSIFIITAFAAVMGEKKMPIITVCTAFFIVYVMFLVGWFYHDPNDQKLEVRLHAHSNLIVEQSDQYLTSDYQEKGYPYCLYVKDPTRRFFDLIYLGSVENGELMIDGDNDTSRLFARYYDYIQTHQLNYRFKYMTYFERSTQVVDSYGVAQYVLRGSGITLKINSNNQEIECEQEY